MKTRGKGKNRKEEIEALQGISIAFKKYLTLKECEAYTDRSETTLSQWFKEYGIQKTPKGYYKREDIDKMIAGELPAVMEIANAINI